jgi:hypothetical protein|tara:strand:- start:347 stop:547 length:201 start_codon:yes stop_codon:yes gene_type:complete
MSKKELNELNVVSRFIGDFFDNIQKGTSDRLLKKAKQRGFPPKVLNSLERIKKEKEELDKLLKKYK